MGSLLVDAFSFSFLPDGQIDSIFYVFQTPGIPMGPYSLAFPSPSPLLFFPLFPIGCRSSALPALFSLLVCNLFAGVVSLIYWASSQQNYNKWIALLHPRLAHHPCVAWVKPLANSMPAAAHVAHMRLSALYIFP